MTVYLDHNATSPLRDEVRELWFERIAAGSGNPSSLHAAGRRERAWIDEARERVASCLDVPEETVVFTPSGTAANNLVLLGGVRRARGGLVVSAVEHAAVLEPAEALEEQGFAIRRVAVDAAARVDPEHVARAVAELGDRTWVSIMAANNEVGTCPRIDRIVEACRAVCPDVRVHTDAVQALGKVPIDLGGWGVDAATLSPHKVGGPRGIGILFASERTELEPLVRGGGQERGWVAGTEDAARCSAAALAVVLAVEERETAVRVVRERTRALWEGLRERVPGIVLHGPPLEDEDRLPNTLNVGLPGIDGRLLVTRLDLEGLATSAGSACASGAVEPSHVLRAMGLDDGAARRGLRLSCSASTTERDVHEAVDILARVARGRS